MLKLEKIKNRLENEYHLIDGYIEKIEYDSNTRNIVIVIRNSDWGFPYIHIAFVNVFYFNAQEFDFHYSDKKIYFIEITSPNEKIEELCNSIQGEKFEERLSEIKNQNLSRIKIYMVSANEYEIICENVIISMKEN